jgi:glutaredoxin-dependent peroxiredoxin
VPRQRKILPESVEKWVVANRKGSLPKSPWLMRADGCWRAGGFMPSVDVGTKAPDFTLVDQDRKPVTLSDSLGRPVVLVFFPGAFSSTCTAELCTFNNSMARLNAAHAQVYGISVDTFFALKAFRDSQHLSFPLLSDFNKEVIRLYDVFFEDMIGLKGLAKRAVLVIDREGVVRHREVVEDARNEPNYGAVFSALASL